MSSPSELLQFYSNLPWAPNSERHDVGIQTDLSPRSQGPTSSQYEHNKGCEALEESEDLEQCKLVARAWYRTCKIDQGKELWNTLHFFLVATVQNQRLCLFDARCVCLERFSDSDSSSSLSSRNPRILSAMRAARTAATAETALAVVGVDPSSPESSSSSRVIYRRSR